MTYTKSGQCHIMHNVYCTLDPQIFPTSWKKVRTGDAILILYFTVDSTWHRTGNETKIYMEPTFWLTF